MMLHKTGKIRSNRILLFFGFLNRQPMLSEFDALSEVQEDVFLYDEAKKVDSGEKILFLIT